jgi:hypothetical protein
MELFYTLHNPVMELVHHSLDALEAALIARGVDSLEHL